MIVQWLDGEVLAVIDGDTAATIDKRETATGSWFPVEAGGEERIQRIRVQNTRQRWERTGLPTIDSAYSANNRGTHLLVTPDF